MLTQIEYIREESGSPYFYGQSGWSFTGDGWDGSKSDSYGLESTLFLTGPMARDTTLKIKFTIKEITCGNDGGIYIYST